MSNQFGSHVSISDIKGATTPRSWLLPSPESEILKTRPPQFLAQNHKNGSTWLFPIQRSPSKPFVNYHFWVVQMSDLDGAEEYDFAPSPMLIEKVWCEKQKS